MHEGWGRLAPFVALVLFTLAILALHRVLGGVSYQAVVSELKAITSTQLLLAVIFTAGSFVALSGYDWLALRYIGKHLPYGTVALVAFCSYALSNTVGVGLLSGGSVRCRMYQSTGMDAADTARIALFSAAGIFPGITALIALATLAHPELVAGFLYLPERHVRVVAAVVMALLATLVTLLLWRRQPLRIGEWSLRRPAPAITALQFAIPFADIACACACLYVLMDAPASFLAFLSVYAIALAAGMLSQIPGGVGAFEAVMLFGLRGTVTPQTLTAALVGYRAIYNLLPLSLATIVIAAREFAPQLRIASRSARRLATWAGRMVPTVLAAIIFINGVVLLLSTATPSTQERLELLRLIVPLPFIEISALFASVAGSALLVVAHGVYRKLNGAYLLALSLCVVGSLLAMLKGIDYEEALVLAGGALALWLNRRQFYRRTALLDAPFSRGWLVSVLGAMTAMYWLVAFSYKHVDYANTLWWEFAYRAELSRSLRAALAASIVLLLVAVRRLLRPPLPAPWLPPAVDLDRAERVVQRGDHADANLALLGDKYLLFSTTGDRFVMYGVHGASWIALGDPVGPGEAAEDLAWRFRETVDAAGGRVAFYQTRPDTLPMYLDMGLTPLKIGEHATVPLARFSLDGSQQKNLRHVLNRGARDGLRLEIVARANVPGRVAELQAISNAWLQLKAGREKRFSLGAFTPAYISRFDVAVVLHQDRPVAFANLFKTGTRQDVSMDLMRHLPDAPDNTMMFLFLELMLRLRAEGYERLSLGMAPLSGMETHPLAPLWHRFARVLYNRGERFYNFHGLRAFKQKFNPQWEPRYLITVGGLNPWLVMTDVAAMIAGGIQGISRKTESHIWVIRR